ncbi:MAG: PAS domain S-box protein [Bacteroidota bacterium]|nr:PAS domain S-box protein [Bacteroidota bacterium]
MKKKKILIVEDEKAVARDLHDIFCAVPYAVIISTGKQSVQTAVKKNPDVILMAITLKGKMNGIEAAQKILEVVDAPLIFLASTSDLKKLQRAKIADPYGYILKPFDKRDVRAAVEIALYKHKAEEELREQRRWRSTILRSIGDAVIATDKKGHVIFMNIIAETLTGWKERDVIGKKLSDVFIVINEETGKKLPNPAARVIKNRHPLSLTNHTILVARNGSRTYIENSGAPIFDESGKISGVVLTFRDVTERRRVQDILNTNERRFRALVEKSTEAVSIVDTDGTIQYTTNTTTAVLGYPAEEFIGKKIYGFIHPHEQALYKSIFPKILQQHGKGIPLQFRFRHKFGGWRWLDTMSTNLLNDPAVNGIVVNFRDFTYRKEAEERLSHINKRLDLISRVTGEVIGSLPIQEQIQEMAAQVKNAFDVDTVIVRLVNDEESNLLAAVGIVENQITKKLPSRYGLSGLILSSRHAIAIKNLTEQFDDLYAQSLHVEDKTRSTFLSCAGAPLLIGHTVIGTIGLYTRTTQREFTSTDLEHLQIVANHIAVAAANDRLFKEIREQNIELGKHIEEQAKIENLLRESEERYRALVEYSPNAIAVHVNGIVKFVNQAAITLVGATSSDQLIETNVMQYVHPDYRSLVSARVSAVYSNEAVPSIEQKWVRLDGSIVDVEIVSIPFLYQGQNAAQIIARDITERKRAEKTLQESEEKYRLLAETAKDIIVVYNIHGDISYINRTGLEYFGFAKEQYFNKNLFDFIPEEYHDQLRHNFGEKVEGFLGSRLFEIEIISTNGRRIPVEVSSNPIVLDGELVNFLSIARDITERKQAEEALLESELRFRSLFENAKDAVFIIDTKTGVIVDANAEAEKLLCRPRTEIIGSHHTQLHPPGRVDEAMSIFREQILTLGEHPIEFEVIDANHKIIPVEIKSSVIRLDDNRIVAQGIFRDITERRQAEETIRKSEQKYRTLFEESKDGIYISTDGGKFVDVNPALVDILGYASKDELLNVDINTDIYFRPVDRDKFRQAIDAASYVKDLELSLRKKDGMEVNVLLTSTVERGPDNTVLYYSGTIRDITVRKRLEQQLIQAQKMESIGTLAGGIAHDFNNLLAMILGTAELLKFKAADNPSIISYIKKIIDASERGASISRQLLLFARPEQAELKPLSIAGVVEEVHDFLNHFFPKNITLSCVIDEKLAIIMGDSGHVHQAIVNLALNAKDAMPNGGALTLGLHVVKGTVVRKRIPAAENREYIAVTIRDTGVGMDEEVRGRIFEPFFSTKARGKGTGLGLAIVHGIVTLHHGFVDVETEKGKGTSFALYFPLFAIAEMHPKEKKELMTQSHHETILVVDDEEMLRDILFESLQDQGYHVLSAVDGYDALQMYEQNKTAITLVITDLGMPNMGGEELFERLKKITPSVKVIVSSGFLDTSTKSDLLRRGIKDVLAKPYRFDTIFSTIRRVIDTQ